MADRDQRLLVGEGLFVREQHPLVGDRDDIVVERAGSDRVFGLLREDRPLRIEAMEPGDGPGGLDMLPGRERAARHAIDENLDAGSPCAGASRM